MSWYSGSHDTITSSSTSSSAAIAIASRLAQIVRFGSITPLGSAVDPLVNCSTASRSGSSAGRSKSLGRMPSRRDVVEQVVEQHHRRIARSRLDERREVGVDHDERRCRRARIRARVCATNSSIEPSRIGSGSTTSVGAAQPDRLDGGDQRAGGRAEQGDVAAGMHPPPLQRGGQLPGLVVEPADGHPIGVVAGHERDRAVDLRPRASIRDARVSLGAGGTTRPTAPDAEFVTPW